MNKKKWILALISVFLGLIILSAFLAKPFIKSRIDKKLNELRDQQIEVSYNQLSISLLSRRITLIKPVVEYREGTHFSAKEIILSGIHVVPLVFDHRVHINHISIKQGLLVHEKTNKPDKVKDGSGSDPTPIQIDRIDLRHGTFEQLDPASDDTTTLITNCQIQSLKWNSSSEKAFDFASFTLDSTHFTTPFYRFTSPRLGINNDRELYLDTLVIRARYPRTEFAQKKKIEADQFNGTVYRVHSSTINFNIGDSVSFSMNSMEVGFGLQVFRDKRFKDDTRYKPLPMELLGDIPWHFHIDTVSVTPSKVEYVEHVEDPDTIVHVNFDQLTAKLVNLSNHAPFTLSASANFMNAGTLSIETHFKENDPAYLHGTLTDFNLSGINNLLGPFTNVQVEEGKIVRLKFDFYFNNDRSDGQIDLSYKNLKISRLNDHHEKRGVVSMLINLFIKNDTGKYVTGESNKGTIQYTRDKHKGVFPFWWKSLLDGIKSSFIKNGNPLSLE